MKRETENLERKLEAELSELAVYDNTSASTIKASLCCGDWYDEQALQEYQNCLEKASFIIRDKKVRIQKDADTSFIKKMSDLTKSDSDSIESVAEVLAEIAEVTQMDVKEASDLLADLGIANTAEKISVAKQLEAVISGSALLSKQLRENAESIIAARDQEEAGDIAMETLAELGYDVSGEFSTLFVKGGMVHFQKPGWKDYYVRMRVSPEEHFFNLNMVRVGTPDDSREQKANDAEMEHAWCGDYPRMLDELTRHGIVSSNTRALDPGAVAVQPIPESQAPVVSKQQKQRKNTRKSLSMQS
ncbi:MAG: hypothetical protein PHN84_12555 [Desulfuromonadaceae bacterium]|nr:hypothetical protein [Desulfuromonadaceae bacterium]MDD2855799.1 hypothetical protein [Desulfuromonadaceae bacterium]